MTAIATILNKVRDDIASLEKRLAEAKAAENYLVGMAEIPERQERQAARTEQVVAPLAEAQPIIGPYTTMKQFEAAAMILRTHGQPMKTADIVSEMIAGGFPQTDEKKLRVSLFTTLMRKPTMFAKAGSGTWSVLV